MHDLRPTLTIGSLLCAGCADWPRFANSPDLSDVTDAVPKGLPALGERLSEAELGEWPPHPTEIADAQSHSLDDLWVATVLEGTLAPWGELGAGVAFGCDATEVAGQYTGDVDFALLRSGQGARLCLLLDAPPGDAPPTGWDVLVYAYDRASACITGDFLTVPAAAEPDQPGWTEPGGKTWVEWAPPGDLAVYVAGAAGAYATAPAWTLYVVPVATLDSCDTLDTAALAALESQE